MGAESRGFWAFRNLPDRLRCWQFSRRCKLGTEAAGLIDCSPALLHSQLEWEAPHPCWGSGSAPPLLPGELCGSPYHFLWGQELWCTWSCWQAAEVTTEWARRSPKRGQAFSVNELYCRSAFSSWPAGMATVLCSHRGELKGQWEPHTLLCPEAAVSRF